MTLLIDKSALVAEIESKIEKYTKRGAESDAKRDGYGMYWGGVLSCLNEVRALCDALEVKEVDLEKELSYKDYVRFFEEHPNFPSDWGFDETWFFAKYFFEFGLKAQKGE